MDSQPVYIALGANLGDPVANLGKAAGLLLRTCALAALSASSVWRTRPVGLIDAAPDFCNAVVGFDTDLSPGRLLHRLQAIEKAMGRRRSSGHYESRVIDLDIIDYDGMQLCEDRLVIPHPRAHLRGFVLVPLREINPTFRFPGIDRSLDELIHAAADKDMERLTPLTPWE